LVVHGGRNATVFDNPPVGQQKDNVVMSSMQQESTVTVKDGETMLVVRAQQGDREALGVLQENLYPRMYRIAYSYSRNHELAQDALQDSCIQVIKHIGSLRRASQFSSWMGRIVINSVRQIQRRGRRIVSTGLSERDLDTVFTETPLSTLTSREQLANAETLLKATRPDDHDLFLRLYVAGQSIRSVSVDTGLSVAAIKTRVHRARRRLRNEMGSPQVAT
jgi:RNA polymerase sigma-70 factor (ECF subfamily)